MKHVLKLHENFVSAVNNGTKNFEIRYNDRGYQKGDLVKFNIVGDDTDKILSYGRFDGPGYIFSFVNDTESKNCTSLQYLFTKITNEEACSILNKIYEITYVLQGTVFGLAPDYCVFGIKEINKE